MKKKIIIIALAVLVSAAVVPVPKTYADGTKSYSALSYKIVKWNRPYYKSLTYTETEVYKFPRSLKSVDELWEGMAICPAVSEVTGTVSETGNSAVALEPDPDGNGAESGETLVFDAPEELVSKVEPGDKVKIEYTPALKDGQEEKAGSAIDVEKITSAVSDVDPSNPETSEYNVTARAFGSGKTVKFEGEEARFLGRAVSAYPRAEALFPYVIDYVITVNGEELWYNTSVGIAGRSDMVHVNEKDEVNALLEKRCGKPSAENAAEVYVSLLPDGEKEKLSQTESDFVLSVIDGNSPITSPGYDNISDVLITAGNKNYYYDSGSGILTVNGVGVNSDKAVKLSDSDREIINSYACRRFTIKDGAR